ncbi:MAG: M12 family metallo-peptidase [Methylobacter sp.]
MNTLINPLIRPAVIGWAAALAALPGAAAASDDSAQNLTLWLASLPDWAFPLALTLAFTGLALLGLMLFRRWRSNAVIQFTAAFGGAALGLLLALAATDSWHGYLTESITQFPSTASGPPAHARGGRPVALLGDPDSDGASRRPELPQKALQGRARHAQVNFNALDAASLELNLFDDITLTAVRDRTVKNIQGGDVWIGHIEGDTDSEVVLAVKGRALMGTVEYNERTFEIVFAGGATHAVRELDPNSLPAQFEPEESEHDVMEGDTSTDGSSATTSGDTVTSSGQVIDVLVVYTPKSRTNASGASGIESKIINAVTRANQAYLNSKVDIQLNLVGMTETAYTETGSVSTTLTRLQNATDGYMDEVHNLRNQVGADVVMLISADNSACGVAYRMTSLGSWFAPYALGVVHDDSVYNCLGSNNTFAHEIGHIQGNMHDAANSSGTPIYPDSYGYQVCGNYRSIMSYSCSGETRIPYFANPNVTWNGFPTGTANANAARSMNATASTIANFRTPATVVTAPNAPTNLVAAAATSSIVLTWNDNATDESGFIVQRSTDGQSWSQVAALGQNAVSFTNSDLAGGQTYSYRVYAYNSAGNSALSNAASATVEAAAAPEPTAPAPEPVVDTTPPVVSITSPQNGATAAANQKITVSATDDVAVAGVKLFINGKLVSSTNGSSINYTWNTRKATKGSNTIKAEATDSSGNSSSQEISVTVK